MVKIIKLSSNYAVCWALITNSICFCWALNMYNINFFCWALKPNKKPMLLVILAQQTP